MVFTLPRGSFFGLALSIASLAVSGGIALADDAALIQQAKDGLKHILKDPLSAQYDEVRVMKNSVGEEGVCGQVNARNSYGGYVGFKPFYFDGKEAGIVEPVFIGAENPPPGGFAPLSDPIPTVADLRNFYLVGCAGPSHEAVARSYEDAGFNCGVIWSMQDDAINHGVQVDDAVEKAIGVTKSRLQEIRKQMSTEAEAGVRVRYKTTLTAVLADKRKVKTIHDAMSDGGQAKEAFVSACRDQTYALLKKRLSAGG